MLIDDIDFAELYRQQLRFAGRTEKSPAHWDARAEKMSISCSDPADSYLVQLLAKIDLTGAETLFDMGCGPGTVSLALADKLHAVHGVDYSPKMLDVAARRASQMAHPCSLGTAARGNHRARYSPLRHCRIASQAQR